MGSNSSWCPQATKLGPRLFILSIYDLMVTHADLWIDSTEAEIVPKDSVSDAQTIANEVITWSNDN